MRLSAIGGEVTAVVTDAARCAWRHRARYLLVWGLTLAITAVIYPFDAGLLAWVQRAGAGARPLAVALSDIGRFENSSLAFAVVLGVAGLLLRRDRLRRAAAACLLAGIVAGIGVNVLRPTFGRARPESAAEPGLHWLEIRADLHSLPSGHASSNAASAVAVGVVVPLLAPPAVLYALGVAWSRMQLNRHYPTDVIWGLVFGGSVGLAIGVAVRDRRRAAFSGQPS